MAHFQTIVSGSLLNERPAHFLVDKHSSVEETLVEMYLAGVSVRRVEDITEALWGQKVSPGTISKLNEKVYVHIDEWRNRKLEMEYPYVYLDGIWLKRNWGGTFENVSILVALGIDQNGNMSPKC